MSGWQPDEENANTRPSPSKTIHSFRRGRHRRRLYLENKKDGAAALRACNRFWSVRRLGLDWCSVQHLRRLKRRIRGCTTLSGPQGSWTGLDDVKPVGMPSRKERKQRNGAAKTPAPPPPPPPRALKPSQLGALARPIVRQVLSTIGHTVLGPTGMSMAKRAVEGACKLYGSGEYHVADEPPVVNAILKGRPGMGAEFAAPTASLHEINLAATEPLGAVVTGPVAGTFNVVTFDMNVAVRKAFPQLSVLASLYTEFTLEGAVVKFVSNASEYATGGIGDLMMVHQCNPLVPAPAGPQAFLQYSNAVSCKMSHNAMLGLECRTFAGKSLLVRSADNPLIPRTATDAGRLYVATNPAPTYAANAVIGQLFITYHVKLTGFRPDSRPDGYLHMERTGVTNTTPLGTTVSRPAVLGGAFNGATCTSTVLTFDNVIQGDVLRITLLYSNGPGVSITASAPILVGCSLYNLYVGNTANVRTAPPNGTTSATLVAEYCIIVTAALGQTVSFGLPTTGSIPGADVIILGQIVGSGISLSEA